MWMAFGTDSGAGSAAAAVVVPAVPLRHHWTLSVVAVVEMLLELLLLPPVLPVP